MQGIVPSQGPHTCLYLHMGVRCQASAVLGPRFLDQPNMLPLLFLQQAITDQAQKMLSASESVLLNSDLSTHSPLSGLITPHFNTL